MLCKRIIPCLDVDGGRTVKGVHFQGLRDVGDPAELAVLYQKQGADEIVFLDISATRERRRTLISVVEKVASKLMIPFTLGGGVSSQRQAALLLAAGADKISVNTAAVLRPHLIKEIASEHGSQCCVVAIDARRIQDGTGWTVLTHGGRREAGRDAFLWAREAVRLGAGEILLTSWDRDGTRKGFDVALTKLFAENLPVPVIASGGAAGPESFVEIFTQGSADAALAANIFHDGLWSVDALKRELKERGIRVRL
jgi:cyclase